MITSQLIRELKGDEGFVPHEYKDSLGYSTIGYGRLIDKRKGGGLTEDEADYLLSNDVAKAWEQVKKAIPWITDQPETVQRGLVNMAFQMGIDGLLGFKNSLAFIKAGEYDKARSNMEQSKWFKQTPARAKRVISMIRKA